MSAQPLEFTQSLGRHGWASLVSRPGFDGPPGHEPGRNTTPRRTEFERGRVGVPAELFGLPGRHGLGGCPRSDWWVSPFRPSSRFAAQGAQGGGCPRSGPLPVSRPGFDDQFGHEPGRNPAARRVAFGVRMGGCPRSECRAGGCPRSGSVQNPRREWVGVPVQDPESASEWVGVPVQDPPVQEPGGRRRRASDHCGASTTISALIEFAM